MPDQELIARMCEALFLLGSDGQPEVARRLVRKLYAETHDDGLAETIREELRADSREWPEPGAGQSHSREDSQRNRARVATFISELESMREPLEFGELRSAYNGAIDRLRVLESALTESRRGDE